MFKKFTFSSLYTAALFIALASIQAIASTATISANKDVHVKINNTNNHNNTKLNVRSEYDGTGSKTHNAIIQFEMQSDHKLTAANLLLDVVEFTGGSEASFLIWAVKDGSDYEDFDEDTITYNDWSNAIWQASVYGVSLTSQELHATGGDGFVDLLASFTVSSSQLNETVSITSSELLDFIKDDTNGLITLIITRSTQSTSLSTRFASAEHDSHAGPRLFVEAEDREIEVSQDLYVRYGYGNDGDSASLPVKNPSGLNTYERNAMFQFEVDESDDFKSVELMLDVAAMNNTYAKFYVWGMADEAPFETIDENSSSFTSFPIFDNSTDGVSNNAKWLYNEGAMLGELEITDADLNGTVVFTSDALTDMVNDDTNGRITLFITRSDGAGNLWTAFAAREHATLQPARLYLRPNLQANASSSDFELTYAYVDEDEYLDLVMIMNFPDGGGVAFAQSVAIVDYLDQMGYGLGEGTELYNKFSPTQKAALDLAYEELVSDTQVSSDLTKVNLEELILSLGDSRAYELTTFTSRAELVADINSGGLDLEVGINTVTLLSISNGGAYAEIYGSNAAASMTLSDDKIMIGAGASYWSASVGYTSASGTGFSITGGVGIGGIYGVSYEDGVMGMSIPVTPNITLSIYVHEDDAQWLYDNTIEKSNGYMQDFEDWIGYEIFDYVDTSNVNIVEQVNQYEETLVYVKKSSEAAYVFIKDAGEETLIVLEDTAASVASGLDQVFDRIEFAYLTSSSAVTAAYNWSVTVGSSIATVFSDGVDWVEDTVSTIGNSIKKGLKKLFG